MGATWYHLPEIAVCVEDPERWPAEALAAAHANPTTNTYGDWVMEPFRAHIRAAAQAYVDAHPFPQVFGAELV